jgi:hypothetical protein
VTEISGVNQLLKNYPPQTISPNFLKIVENLSSHEKNYFRSIKTYFKNIWSNAKGDHRYPRLSNKGGPQKIFQKIKRHSKAASNYKSKLSENC